MAHSSYTHMSPYRLSDMSGAGANRAAYGGALSLRSFLAARLDRLSSRAHNSTSQR